MKHTNTGLARNSWFVPKHFPIIETRYLAYSHYCYKLIFADAIFDRALNKHLYLHTSGVYKPT